MAAYTFKRLLWLIPVLFFISIITFSLMHAVPGGPWDDGDKPPSPEALANIKAKYGWDKPLVQQYLLFVSHAVQGDLGVSYARQGRPVTGIIVSGFKVSAVLGLVSLGLAMVVGVTLGVLSALYRNRWPDYAGVAVASLGSAVPGFVLAVLLMYVFSLRLHWLPTFGWSMKQGLIPGWLPKPEQMVLPVITLAALPAAYLARVTRASLLEVLRQDYMRTARSKGLSSTTILLRHAMRNAAIPMVTVIGPMTAALLTGSFVVEHIFTIPGSGQLMVQSVLSRDYGMIMGITLFLATVIVLANLAVDLAYAYCDPRIRFR